MPTASDFLARFYFAFDAMPPTSETAGGVDNCNTNLSRSDNEFTIAQPPQRNAFFEEEFSRYGRRFTLFIVNRSTEKKVCRW